MNVRTYSEVSADTTVNGESDDEFTVTIQDVIVAEAVELEYVAETAVAFDMAVNVIAGIFSRIIVTHYLAVSVQYV